jgi:phage major head subunit gpT-like protein
MRMTLTKKKPPEQSESGQIPGSLLFTASCTLDLEAAKDDSSAGALPRFRMVAYTGTPMRVGGWRHPVIIDLAGLTIPSQSRPIRFGHDPLSGVGHTDSIRVEAGLLVASGVVSRDTPAAREVVVSSKNGFPWQASVGASVEEFEFVKESQKVTVNGQQYAGPLNVVRKSSLGEISFVDLGADGATSASVAALSPPASGESNMDEPLVSSQPQSDGPAAQPTAQPVETAMAAAIDSPAPDLTQQLESFRAQQAAETQRVASIRRICGGRHSEIEARAIRDGWSEQRTELEVLRNQRPALTAVHVPETGVSSAVLEAACLLAAGYKDIENTADEKSLELAERRFRGGIGLQELLLEAAWANGYTGRNFRDSRSVLRFAFGRTVEAAGFSNIDIGGILSNVANKFLLEGFFSVERTWRNICAVRNVSDFKTVNSYRLIGKDQYELVAPGGEIKHGTLGNETYSNRADTYGLLLAIDRRDIINDDLGAITTVPRKLGRGSGLKINDVFWSTFLNNASFFTVGNNNFLAGTDTVLSIDGLTKAETAFMDLTDSDGKPIGIMPAIALVPTALSAMGTQLFKSLELRETTANAKYPISNPHQGKFRVEVSRYLSNSTYTGNSTKAWYLLAEPSDLPVIEVAFLNGQEAPTIETAEADFNVLGVQMRGYHDFGVRSARSARRDQEQGRSLITKNRLREI